MKRYWVNLAAVMAVLFGVVVTATAPVSADPALTLNPASALVDGQEVEVTGSGMTGSTFLIQCPAGVGGATGWNGGCSWQNPVSVTPDEAGGFTVTVMVRAVLTVGSSAVDCRTSACDLVAARLGDETDDPVEVARVPLAFDPSGDLVAAPTVSVSPASNLVDGQVVEVTGSGFEPGSWTSGSLCANDGGRQGCRYFSLPEIGSSGTLTSSVTVRAALADSAGSLERVDCRSATAVCTFQVWSADWNQAAPVVLHFDPSAPLLPPPTVSVDPQHGLVDGQVVTVQGSGFTSGDWVWLALCSSGAGPEPEACRELGDGDTYADDDGGFSLPVRLRALIPTGDDEPAIDCRVVACVIRVSTPDGAVAHPVEFDPSMPLLPPPSVSVSPRTKLTDGQVVTVTLTNFDPGDWLSVQVCQSASDLCDPESTVYPEIDLAEPTVITLAVYGTFPTYTEPVDCRVSPGCEIRVRSFGPVGALAAAPISFGPPAPSRGRFVDPVFGEIEVTHDVVYRSTFDHLGRPIDLKMDIYQPVGDPLTVRPAVMWMHGGWFIFGDKSNMEPYARASAQRGYVGISLQYRLRPDISTSELDQVVAAARDARVDAAAAVEWIIGHSGDLGVDPRAVLVGGYSAGGVLSWNLAYPDESVGDSQPGVAAAAPIAGIPFSGPDPGDPPVIGFHAVDDGTVPYSVGRDRCSEAALVAVVCRWVEYPQGGHGIVSSQFRDIVERSHLFFFEQVLSPLGYVNDQPNQPAPPTPSTRPELVLPPDPPGVGEPSGPSTTMSTTTSSSTVPVTTLVPPTTVPSTTGSSPSTPTTTPRWEVPAAPGAAARPGRAGYTG